MPLGVFILWYLACLVGFVVGAGLLFGAWVGFAALGAIVVVCLIAVLVVACLGL